MRTVITTVSSFLVAFVLACVPPQQQPVAAGPEAGAGPAPVASGGDHSASCGAACQNFHQCGLQEKQACMRECDGVEPERLDRFASYTCEELTAVVRGTVGQRCMTTGHDDCGPYGPDFVCCGGNPATGTPGQCISGAVCAAPRY